MTDVTSPANGSTRSPESTQRANPVFDGTSGEGDPTGTETPAAPDSGGATALPGWPGVAHPAGWSLPATGEAAPPAWPGTEPARTDAGDPGIPVLGNTESDTPQPDMPSGKIPGAGISGAEFPVTEHAQPAEWDIQPAIASSMSHSASEGTRDPADHEPDEPADYEHADNWREDSWPAPARQISRPGPRSGSWQETAGPATWAGPWQEPTGPAMPAQPLSKESPGPAAWAGPWQEPAGPATPAQSWKKESPGPAAPAGRWQEPSSPAAWAGPWREPLESEAWPPAPEQMTAAPGPGEETPPSGPWLEATRPEPRQETTRPEPLRPESPRPEPGRQLPGRMTWAGPWLEPPGPATWAGPSQEPPGPETGPVAPPREIAQTELPQQTQPQQPWREPAQREPWQTVARFAPPPGTWQAAPRPAAGESAPHIPAVGPTPALHGWAGGPGFAVRPQDASEHDPAPRSPWQLAQGAWQDSGISWEQPAAERGRGDYPSAAISRQSRRGDARGDTPPPRTFAADADEVTAGRPGGPARRDFAPPEQPDSLTRPEFASDRSDTAALPSAFAAMPLGAPTFADVPAAPRPEAPHRSARSRPPEPDELYQAWQGSVRQASARPKMTARRKRQAWRLLRAGLPIAVIVTVGAGAVMMLTGKTNEVLADRARPGSPAAGAKGGMVAVGGSATLTGSTFYGYPGQHGMVMVNSVASSGGTWLAVGSADGHPAIWRRAASGAWTLVSATSPAVYQRPGFERLTGIAHGAAGWVAVGGVVSGAVQQPVVLTSADGVTWRALDRMAAFAEPGTYVMGVTAGPGGYVVVGKQVSRGRVFAAMWWSADLRSWIAGKNGGLDGRLESSTVYAVAAVPAGFIAAGTHGDCHSVWTSADGRMWQVHDVLVPPGATSAMLDMLAVNGSRVVAAGYAVLKSGDIPIVVVSADGGRHWRQIVLAAPGTFGAVTSLTAAGSGFVAAGVAGPAGSQHAVTWSSPDGQTWSAATQAGIGTRQITALTAAGRTVTATVQQGADPSTITLPAP